MRPVFCALLSVVGALASAQSVVLAQESGGEPGAVERYFAPGRLDEHRRMETVLLSAPDPNQLRAWHDMTASRPHRAGTDGDARVIEAVANAFTSMGLVVERHPFWALLAEPVSASVQLLAPEIMDLPLIEPPVAGDPYSEADGLSYGWNAYSGSGTAEGGVVYANYARKQDFERLAELGVSVGGKIVIARFGGNFRGYKATYAQEAGAAGLLIYTDPADSGFTRGLEYPEGGWANEWKIQRGSLLALPYPGDALTPGVEATEHASRLDPATVGLPTIPVQPIGWSSAEKILSRMRGREIEDQDWQGGLPFRYRIEGGDDLQVRMSVEQNRKIVRTENVVATLKGSAFPDQAVIVGCHHDAWEYGASDPTSGLIAVLESARSFAEAAAEGHTPLRSVVFAAWGAEEFGVIGSTEWVEANESDLLRNAIAYVNLDAAGMGPNFGSSASPSLKSVILGAAADTPAPPASDGTVVSLLENWRSRTSTPADAAPRFGNLGGGSDHVGFYCRVGVPSAGVNMGGAGGDAYHSNYDNLTWYRATVGTDYESARALTRVTNLILARLADADVPPFDPVWYATDVVSHAEAIQSIAATKGITLDMEPLRASAAYLAVVAERFNAALGAADPTDLATLEREWLDLEGLTDRPWFRNTFAATDPTSGYAAWMLPNLRRAVEAGDQAAADSALDDIRGRIDAIRETLSAALNGLR